VDLQACPCALDTLEPDRIRSRTRTVGARGPARGRPLAAPVDGPAGATSTPAAPARWSPRTECRTAAPSGALTAGAAWSMMGLGVSNARRLERPSRVRNSDPPWAPGNMPVRRARGRSDATVVIRQAAGARGARPSPGDRHISNDRTRIARRALGPAHARDRRLECPPMRRCPPRLAAHRSPA